MFSGEYKIRYSRLTKQLTRIDKRQKYFLLAELNIGSYPNSLKPIGVIITNNLSHRLTVIPSSLRTVLLNYERFRIKMLYLLSGASYHKCSILFKPEYHLNST
jgi:hypothetical protein